MINAAGSGVGSAAIQCAHLAGARIIATAGSDEKLARARQLGADEVINYNETPNIGDVARDLTDGRGAHRDWPVGTGPTTSPKPSNLRAF